MKILSINDKVQMENGKTFTVTWFDGSGVTLVSGKDKLSLSPQDFETMLAKGKITITPRDD